MNKSYYQNLYHQRKTAGLCTKCANKVESKKILCEKCNAKKRKRRQRYKEASLCGNCAVPTDGLTLCESCRKKNTISRLSLREKRLLDGLCRCGNKPCNNYKYCNQCLEKQRIKNKQYRNHVFNAYGGFKCNCCGENEEEFLTIDHINNDGYRRRKITKEEPPNGGTPFYLWLIKNNYPPVIK